MIQDWYSKDLAGLNQLCCGGHIVGAGLEDPGRMVVGEDYCCRTIGYGIHKDLSGVDLICVEESNGHHPIAKDLICPVQRDAEEIFLFFVCYGGDKRQHIFGTVNYNTLL